MKVIYRERTMLGNYKCIDKVREFYYMSAWKPEGTSLWYFKNGYNIKPIAEEDIINKEVIE